MFEFEIASECDIGRECDLGRVSTRELDGVIDIAQRRLSVTNRFCSGSVMTSSSIMLHFTLGSKETSGVELRLLQTEQ